MENLNRLKNHSIEQQKEPEFLGRITLMRHGQTNYTEVYPDLTDKGMETAQKTAEQILANLKEDERVGIRTSDKARAQGTADIVKDVLEHAEDVRVAKGITSMGIRDPEKAKQIFDELMAAGGVNYDDPVFGDTSVFEVQDEIQGRFFRNLEYTIRAFTRINAHEDLPKPHLIAVTHFEVLHPLLRQVFGPEYTDDRRLENSEHVEISVLNPRDDTEKGGIIFLDFTFRGTSKRVGFDRKTRTLVPVE